jgi:hypothetical protein
MSSTPVAAFANNAGEPDSTRIVGECGYSRLMHAHLANAKTARHPFGCLAVFLVVPA